MPRFLTSTALAASLLAGVGCANGSDLDSAGGSGGGTSTTTTGATGGADGGTDGGEDAGAPSCTLPTNPNAAYAGSLRLYRVTIDWPPGKTGGFDMFMSFVPPPGPAACMGTTMGACCYTPPGVLGDYPAGQAGTIVVTDGAKTLVTMEEGTSGYGDANNTTVPTYVWSPGDALHITASGDAIDAFAGTVVAPEPLSGLSPAFDAGSIPVDTTSDLVITWKPSADPCARIYLLIADGGFDDGTIDCTPADADGKVTVPAAFLAQMKTNTGGAILDADMERYASVGPPSANATVELRVADVQYTKMNLGF